MFLCFEKKRIRNENTQSSAQVWAPLKQRPERCDFLALPLYRKQNAVLVRWSIRCRVSGAGCIHLCALLCGRKFPEKENTFRGSKKQKQNEFAADWLIHQSSCQQAYT